MATKPKRKIPKAKRRLLALNVDEISLVDFAAQPLADEFCILEKRDEEAEIEAIRKAFSAATPTQQLALQAAVLRLNVELLGCKTGLLSMQAAAMMEGRRRG